MMGSGHFLLRLRMSSIVSSSAFSPTLLGFQNKALEAEFQADFARELKRLDLFANLSFAVLMLYISWRLSTDGAARFEVLSILLGMLVIHTSWLWITTWPNGIMKARFRAWVITAQRLHNVYCGVVCDRVILFPYMKEESLAYVFHNTLTASRVLVFPMLILGMRLPFRHHLPTQLATTLAFTKLNQRLCNQCSLAMQNYFGATADALSRVSSASYLLTPQIQPPSIHTAHACLAVNELIMLSCGVLLPTLVLCFLETKARQGFLLRSEQMEGAAPLAFRSLASTRHAKEELGKAACVSIFPVTVAIVALPVLSFLWQIHVVVDKLLS